MRRREMLLSAGAALAGLSAFPLRCVTGQDNPPRKKVLYFTRSAGFEHEAVRRTGGELSESEKVLTELGAKNGFAVECTKDGSVFNNPDALRKFDVIAFYTSDDLTKPCNQPGAAMSKEGPRNFLAAVKGGVGFVGFHACTDSFRSPGQQISGYTAMVGAEFVSHGPSQEATMKIASPDFPGIKEIRSRFHVGDSFKLAEEWYAQQKFSQDMHVILVQETKGMTGDCYQRPPFPATWARKHGEGRVFYTSLGHGPIQAGGRPHDVWKEPLVHEIILGGLRWAARVVDFDPKPNISEVTPKASQMHY
jgi:type 1 glutamine amidotransferase